MCALKKGVLLINTGRFSLAATLALFLITAIATDADNAPQDQVDVATLAGEVLLTVLGINDAMANDDKGDDGGNDTGGYQAGCSDNDTSNSPNSAHCEKKGGGGSEGGDDGGDDSASAGDTAGDDSGAAADPEVVASFTFCDSGHHGAAGRLFELYANGRTLITKVRCN